MTTIRSTRRVVRAWRALEVLMVAAATAYAAYGVARAPAWTVDDAWIVVRYAENLAHHGRLAWNLDGQAVEGFTSLTGTLAAAAAARGGLDPIRVLDALGAAGLLASGGVLLAMGRAVRAPPPAAGMVAVAHLTMAEHVTHAGSGLETELFVALGLVLLVSFARAGRRARRSVTPVALAGLALTLTRPEGAAAACIALGVIAWVRRADKEALRRTLHQAGAGFVLPMVALTAWRYRTFGAALPNTWFAKRAEWNLAHLRDVAALANAHLVDLVLVAGVCVAVAFFVAGRARSPEGGERGDIERSGRARPLTASERLLAVAAAATLMVLVLAGARSLPIMDFARRFAFHSLPWLDALALVATSAGVRASARAQRTGATTAAVLVGLFGVATAAVVARGLAGAPSELRRIAVYERSSRELLLPIVAWISANTGTDATIAVYPDAGLVPHRTGRRTIDFGRLNDAHLAREARGPADVVAYFFARDPDVLVVSQPRAGKLWDDGAEALVSDPRFVERYALALQRDEAGGIAVKLYARRPR